MPDSLRVLILWIFFMGASMYLSSKCGSFTDDKREGTEENMKRKRSKDEGNMEAMEAMEAMKRKSENRKELNHQGEFDIV